jgi:putative oxidoreductase
MLQFPFLSTQQWLTLLRVAIGLMMAAHGGIRLYAGTVDGFGGFLESKGFPAGIVIAWAITIFEIAGGVALAFGFYVRAIAAAFILELAMGIILVHAAIGWFVVGYTSGGAEYATLMILCFLLVASTKR